MGSRLVSVGSWCFIHLRRFVVPDEPGIETLNLASHLATVCGHRRSNGAHQEPHQGAQQGAPCSRHARYRFLPL